MKKLFSLLLTFSFLGMGAQAQTADEIITKNIKAMGGVDKLKSIQSVVMEGKINAQGMEIPISMSMVKNTAMRTDFSVMGMNAWMIMRKDSGWTFMPFQGQTKPEAVPADMLKETEDQLDLEGELVDYKEKGSTVEYLGMDDVEGTDCHKLKLVTKAGNVHYYLIDPKTFYTVRRIAKQNAGGKEVEVQVDMGNYKEVEGGFIFPFTVTSMGGPVEMTKIVVNGTVDSAKFSPGM